MFVNGENPPTSGCEDCYAQHEALIRKVVQTAERVSTPERKIYTSYYMDASISTGADDWVKFADSRVLDVHGKQVLYRPCSTADSKYANLTAARQGEMPMFVGTLANSYGPIILRYVDKIFELGVNGVYHDEYGYSEVSFTYGAWDNHSAFLHPSDLSIRALVGSLDLLSMELELELQKIIAANNGFFMANGPPLTRTIINGRFGVHFQEDSQHCRVKHVQTYTPVMLNRAGASQSNDVDPKYASRKGNRSAANVCWNIVNHLDDGVLSENYDGMFPKTPDLPTIWESMWPITVVELGDGFVIGLERVVTKASGTFVAPAGAGEHHVVFLYEQCLLVGTATRNKGIGGGSITVGDEKVAVSLKPQQQAVIVWG
jgi:hypothetical protein